MLADIVEGLVWSAFGLAAGWTVGVEARRARHSGTLAHPPAHRRPTHRH